MSEPATAFASQEPISVLADFDPAAFVAGLARHGERVYLVFDAERAVIYFEYPVEGRPPDPEGELLQLYRWLSATPRGLPHRTILKDHLLAQLPIETPADWVRSARLGGFRLQVTSSPDHPLSIGAPDREAREHAGFGYEHFLALAESQRRLGLDAIVAELRREQALEVAA